jgi:hypothetical protein
VAAVYLRKGLTNVPRSRRRPAKPPAIVADQILEPPDASVLDLLDRLLDKGVMADGDVTIGIAGIDLIYVRLAALVCAADRVLPRDPLAARKRSRHRLPGSRGMRR